MSNLALRGGKPVHMGTWPKWPIHDEREVERVVKVTRSGQWAWAGPEEQEFRANFKQFLGAKHGLCVTNGTHALQLALEALDVGYGDEVIVPGQTWQATAACALDVNAVPILVDIELDTLTMDADALRAAITPRTKAIIPVHLFSCVANMDEIMAIANEHRIPVIEDCSHQHGSEWRGKKVGSIGSIGAFSLQGSKVLNSGEGGFISTNEDRLFHRLDSLRNCGRHNWGGPEDHADHYPQSGNFRFTEFQAAILNCQLARLEEQTARRDENAQYLNRLLAEIPGLKPMRRREQVTRQQYYAYTFRYNKDAFEGLSPERFRKAMHAETGLGIGGTYEPLNKCSLYKPQTKKRHKLNDDYWKLIDPRRFELPNCAQAQQEVMAIGQTALLAGSGEMEKIAEAAAKIQKHAGELLNWEPAPAAVAVK
jgi:L-glutamine:2-deoxy-scyllo-inosose/3-amino-2,3-dideoxy-scyllo-inosose aminotransferase